MNHNPNECDIVQDLLPYITTMHAVLPAVNWSDSILLPALTAKKFTKI